MGSTDNGMPEPLHQRDPWTTAEARYPPGQIVTGIVTRIAPFGVFVRVEEGFEGVIYQSRLAHGAGTRTSMQQGQRLTLYVTGVDANRRRMELGFAPDAHLALVEKRSVPFPSPASVRSIPGERLCSSCTRPVEASWKHCVYCGHMVQRICTACGTRQPVIEGARFCCECGVQLEDTAER